MLMRLRSPVMFVVSLAFAGSLVLVNAQAPPAPAVPPPPDASVVLRDYQPVTAERLKHPEPERRADLSSLAGDDHVDLVGAPAVHGVPGQHLSLEPRDQAPRRRAARLSHVDHHVPSGYRNSRRNCFLARWSVIAADRLTWRARGRRRRHLRTR